MEIFFGPFAEDHGRDAPGTVFARWKPWKTGPYKTDGWVTVSIPLTEFKYGKDDADDNETGTTSISNPEFAHQRYHDAVRPGRRPQSGADCH